MLNWLMRLFGFGRYNRYNPPYDPYNQPRPRGFGLWRGPVRRQGYAPPPPRQGFAPHRGGQGGHRGGPGHRH